MYIFCSSHLSKSDITLSVNGNITYENGPIMFQRALLFTQILNMFTNVRHLKFYQSTYRTNGHARFTNITLEFCSNLIELHIHVRYFDDCLRLLDGRLSQLRRFFVSVHRILPIDPVNDNRVSCEQKEEIEVFFNDKSVSLRTK